MLRATQEIIKIKSEILVLEALKNGSPNSSHSIAYLFSLSISIFVFLNVTSYVSSWCTRWRPHFYCQVSAWTSGPRPASPLALRLLHATRPTRSNSTPLEWLAPPTLPILTRAYTIWTSKEQEEETLRRGIEGEEGDATLDLLLKHPNKTFATYVWNSWNICNRRMKHL